MDTAAFGLSNGTLAYAPSHVLQLAVDDAFMASTLWSVPSDARLKTVLGDFTDGLATICALPQSVRFQWNGKGGTFEDGNESVGRIAQDVLPVAPRLIRVYQDRLEPEDPEPTDIYAANDSPLLEMMINAFKELKARVETLEATVATLETRLDALEPGPAMRQAPPAARPDAEPETRRRE